MPERNFAQLQADLERTVLNLKGAKDPNTRRGLLLELRLLLAEADRLHFETPE
jgi:hypothetical protein